MGGRRNILDMLRDETLARVGAFDEQEPQIYIVQNACPNVLGQDDE